MKPSVSVRQARRNYQLPRWRQLRRQVFERDGWRCRQCGRAGRLECDHIRNWREGGPFWSMHNLQALCRGCHIEKTSREVKARKLQWDDRLQGL